MNKDFLACAQCGKRLTTYTATWNIGDGRDYCVSHAPSFVEVYNRYMAAIKAHAVKADA